MAAVHPCPLPQQALLSRYAREGAYTDCYVTELPGRIAPADYVEAFYTTAVFRLERWVLARTVARPSTDLQARQLATGASDRFAAWSVEARTGDQVLMCDFHGRTRSWLMAATDGAAERTRLYFGSAVVPENEVGNGRPRLGFLFRALLGFHKLYSRVLLGSARRRLQRRPRAAG